MITPAREAELLEPTEADALAALYGWCNVDPATKVFSSYQLAALPAWQRALKTYAAHLLAERAALVEALGEMRRAIGDHNAPSDCYATGPLTGDSYRDLVECPACSAIAKFDAIRARALVGGQADG